MNDDERGRDSSSTGIQAARAVRGWFSDEGLAAARDFRDRTVIPVFFGFSATAGRARDFEGALTSGFFRGAFFAGLVLLREAFFAGLVLRGAFFAGLVLFRGAFFVGLVLFRGAFFRTLFFDRGRVGVARFFVRAGLGGFFDLALGAFFGFFAGFFADFPAVLFAPTFRVPSAFLTRFGRGDFALTFFFDFFATLFAVFLTTFFAAAFFLDDRDRFSAFFPASRVELLRFVAAIF